MTTRGDDMARKKRPCVYIGPSLPGLTQNTVFVSDRYPPHVADLIKGNESIAGLIVPIDRLQESRQNVHVKGHILNKHLTDLIRSREHGV